ncbi:apoptosis-associated speck-like protein containing a CARD [Salmo salar]|uniref:Apoptosis-associated speck-like protein containing a CARD n=1 Tax=Salmo salar TaxID=8030 RepID=B9EMM2_SALSA|nr:apoptosis-associated speck-like protein containing a CARD [Salmo salar]ACM08769.1 Apoptosis-associated speck-like protein containing a CARD [Salmo salar]ACN09918.1 Apoptosis-associated speck-like protein containing a CARD [Salmo salar]ACN12265.1 Apoptosis-associated speck-like protein containing a CARD [Salmo salar]|eukprot:XP_014056118.1 PREDICTED: apoptosis-associated speck-like protein containing a CARD [Salmo salar]
MSGTPGPKNMMKDKHFVDHHRTALIDRVSQVEPLLDRLLDRGIITQNAYSEVRANRTNQKKMRELFDGPLKACGPKGKDIFLDILMDLEPFLIIDLKGE